jgi:molybdopterin converting factor small subunit
MKVMVKLFATLRLNRFDRETLDLADDTAVRDVVSLLKIPEKDAAILFLNSRHAELDTVLHEGDTLAIFPPVGGG